MAVIQRRRLGKTELEIYPLDELSKAGHHDPSALPMTVKVLLEGVIRLVESKVTDESNIDALARWPAAPAPGSELPFLPARVLMQDFTGVPAVVDLAAMRSAMKRAGKDAGKVDPLVPVNRLQPIDEFVGSAVALPRLYATLVAVFAATALLLAALGVYGVRAYSVTQRQREIGVRMALGAEPGGIRQMILKQGGVLAGVGLLIGVGLSMVLGQLLSKLLFGVTPFDLPTLIAVPAVLGAVTVAGFAGSTRCGQGSARCRDRGRAWG